MPHPDCFRCQRTGGAPVTERIRPGNVRAAKVDSVVRCRVQIWSVVASPGGNILGFNMLDLVRFSAIRLDSRSSVVSGSREQAIVLAVSCRFWEVEQEHAERAEARSQDGHVIIFQVRLHCSPSRFTFSVFMPHGTYTRFSRRIGRTENRHARTCNDM